VFQRPGGVPLLLARLHQAVATLHEKRFCRAQSSTGWLSQHPEPLPPLLLARLH